MKRKFILVTTLLLSTCALGNALASEEHGDVRISGSIMLNFGSPPPMVWMPEMGVYVAFGSPYPLFFYRGDYFYFYQRHWYHAPGYGGPWARIEIGHVPPHLRGYKDDEWPHFQKRAESYYRKGDRHDHPSFPAWRERRDGAHDRGRDGKGEHRRSGDRD